MSFHLLSSPHSLVKLAGFSVVMAKRVVLADERVYDEMWKRTPTDVSKSQLNNKLQSQLASNDVPDDVKAKLYQQTLKRFLNLKEKVPELKTSTLPIETEPHETKKIVERKAKDIHWEHIPRRKHVK